MLPRGRGGATRPSWCLVPVLRVSRKKGVKCAGVRSSVWNGLSEARETALLLSSLLLGTERTNSISHTKQDDISHSFSPRTDNTQRATQAMKGGKELLQQLLRRRGPATASSGLILPPSVAAAQVRVLKTLGHSIYRHCPSLALVPPSHPCPLHHAHITQGGRTLSALSGRSLEVNAPATEVTQLPSGLRVASEVRVS